MSTGKIRVLFAGHEASRTGAPVGFLSLLEWWHGSGGVEPAIWLRRGGPLLEAHRPLAPLAKGSEAGDLSDWLAEGVEAAYLNTATWGGLAAALHAAGVPVICHAHEMDFELGLTGALNLAQLRRSVAHFIACSEAVKASLQRCAGVAEERITVVPECVDVDRALCLAAEKPAVMAVSPGKRLVCGMGTVGWRKGTDLFLRVVAGLGEDWQGVWIGDLEASPEAGRLRHDLRALGQEGRVCFTGLLANPFAVLQQADVFCLTSREDPYPLAMVEAAALGLPVIGFRGSGGVEEFAAAGGAVLAEYADTSGMAELARRAPRQAGGESLARRLCAPEAVGARLLEVMRSTAAAQVIRLDKQSVAALAITAEETAKVVVEWRNLETGEVRREDWEGPAGAVGELTLECGQGRGAVEIAFQPCLRSVVVANLELLHPQEDGARRALAARVRSSGRAVRLGKEEGGSWLLLDGQGRLHLSPQEPCPKRLLLRWRLSTAVKPELTARLGQAAAPRWSLLRRLGLQKDSDTGN